MALSIRDYIRIVEDAQTEVQAPDVDTLRAQGFNVDEALYHGTNENFFAFDRSKARTADDIYTTPVSPSPSSSTAA